jgi:hypothetical protein
MSVDLNQIKGGITSKPHWVHKNSLEAFKQINVNSRHHLILELCRRENRLLSDRQIMELLGFTDMNAVRPRISELIDFKILSEDGSTIDDKTGKRVRLVKLIPQEKQMSFIKSN